MGKPRHKGGQVDRYSQTKGERRGDYRDRMSHRAKVEHDQSRPRDVSALSIRKPIEYLTENQRILGSCIRANDATFATGPAGTGKTHVAIAERLPRLIEDRKHRFILTNPAHEIGEKLGTLPGDKDEKIAVQMRPMRDILHKLIGASHLENLMENERILFEPLGSILGTTFDNATIIFDEAQNCTPQQIKALLTRVGQDSKIIIAGDPREQKFIEGVSGMEDALKRIGHLRGVGHVAFTADDIVRSGFVKDVILAYREGSDD